MTFESEYPANFNLVSLKMFPKASIAYFMKYEKKMRPYHQKNYNKNTLLKIILKL